MVWGGCGEHWELAICLHVFEAGDGVRSTGHMDVVRSPALLLLSCHSASPSLSLHICKMGSVIIPTSVRLLGGQRNIQGQSACYCVAAQKMLTPTLNTFSLFFQMFFTLIRAAAFEFLIIIFTIPNVSWVPAICQALSCALYMSYLI